MVVLIIIIGGLQSGSSLRAEEEENPPGDEKPRANAEGQVLFDGRTLGKWKVADKFDFEHHGPVSVEQGAIVMKKGSPASGVYYSGKIPRNHYELRLQAKRVEGSDFFCGLTFPVDKSHCTWILGGWGGGVVGLSNLDNISAIENETTDFVEFKQDRWYNVRLRVTPERVQGWIDDKQFFDVETEGRKFSVWWEQEPMRPLGIASWNTTAAIRKLELRSLKGPAKRRR